MNVSRTLILSVLALSACGGVVAYSEPISLKAGSIKESDVQNAAFTIDKEISAESGDPYKRFLDNARAELDGADPSAIEVERIVLTVDGASDGIGTAGFAEIATALEVYLRGGDTTVVVGSLATVPSGTTLEVDVTADAEDLRVLHERMLSKSFKVGLRGDAVASVPAKFELRTNIQITFRALE